MAVLFSITRIGLLLAVMMSVCYCRLKKHPSTLKSVGSVLEETSVSGDSRVGVDGDTRETEWSCVTKCPVVALRRLKSPESEVVCASNGISYATECEMVKINCKNRDVHVEHYGVCSSSDQRKIIRTERKEKHGKSEIWRARKLEEGGKKRRRKENEKRNGEAFETTLEQEGERRLKGGFRKLGLMALEDEKIEEERRAKKQRREQGEKEGRKVKKESREGEKVKRKEKKQRRKEGERGARKPKKERREGDKEVKQAKKERREDGENRRTKKQRREESEHKMKREQERHKNRQGHEKGRKSGREKKLIFTFGQNKFEKNNENKHKKQKKQEQLSKKIDEQWSKKKDEQWSKKDEQRFKKKDEQIWSAKKDEPWSENMDKQRPNKKVERWSKKKDEQEYNDKRERQENVPILNKKMRT